MKNLFYKQNIEVLVAPQDLNVKLYACLTALILVFCGYLKPTQSNN